MFFVLLLLMASTVEAQQYAISTYAGGVPPPTPAPGVNLPVEGGGTLGVAADAAGNAYFTGFHCVFKMDPSGVARTADRPHVRN